jgi:hypothetical protein
MSFNSVDKAHSPVSVACTWWTEPRTPETGTLQQYENFNGYHPILLLHVKMFY